MIKFEMTKSRRLIKCASCEKDIVSGEQRLLMKIKNVSINFCEKCAEDDFTENVIKIAKKNAKEKLQKELAGIKNEINEFE
jgi:hypothetical protein